MRIRAALINNLWQLVSAWEYCCFLRGRGSLRQTQLEQLRSFLRGFERSQLGLRLGVSQCYNYEQFRQRVPLHNYEDLQTHLAQEQGVWPETARVWEPTGGSTGASKWIPWTPTLQAQFRRAVAVWIFDLFRQIPELKLGRSYWQITPKAQTQAPSWLQQQKTGFESDSAYLGPAGKLIEDSVLVSVKQGESDFWEDTVRALSSAPDLRLISCWSPSFLVLLKEKFEQYLGAWKPRTWWPQLRLVSCWTEGPSTPLLPFVVDAFPQAEVQGKSLLSTEAVVTVPMSGLYPLAYRSHFFEFRGSDKEIYPSWGLREGETYEVIVSTGSGLARYCTGDLVKVTGFWGQVPCLSFLSRLAVSDHFGEKLHLLYIQQTLQMLGRFARLVFQKDRYILFLDEEGPQDSVWEDWGLVKSRLEEVYTYQDCRELGQLKELGLFLIKGSGEKQLMKKLGEDYAKQKTSALLNSDWLMLFEGSFVTGSVN